MKKEKKTKVQDSQTIPWHVLLFAIYPVLALLAHNINQVAPASVLLPLCLSIIGAGLLLLLVRFWMRDWQSAALATTLLLVLFSTYGHVYSYLKSVIVSGIYLFRHRSMVVLWIVLAGLVVWWTSQSRLDTRPLTRTLNFVVVILLIFPIFQVSSGLWNQWRALVQSHNASTNPIVTLSDETGSQIPPDIYFIILDGYSRSDIFEKIYGYDNSAFVSSLEKMGFYVADCSQSNYGETELSVSSELNYDYISALGDSFNPTRKDRSPLWPLIKNSALRHFLEARGYKTIAFQTGFSWTEWTDADLYLGPQLSKWQLDDFQYMWLQTTFARILLDAEAFSVLQNSEELFRLRTEFALQELPHIPVIDGPKFIFAHLIIPHPPFVFGPNGESSSIGWVFTPEMAAKGYIDQTTFINKRMLEILPAILANSSSLPIIIVQGDHGTSAVGGADHWANLSAFYLPGYEGLLYPTITNVNTFRVILDAYFGQNLPLLPDVSMWSDYNFPYNFHQVANGCSQ
jgi:hypothetical protein